MRRTLHTLGLALCLTGIATGAVLHVATFITVVSPRWLVPEYALVVGSVLSAFALRYDRDLQKYSGISRWLSFALVIYAGLTFVYFYRINGGVSSLSATGGEYAMYKYRMLPNLWTRVMSAGICAISYLVLMQFLFDGNARQRDV